MAFYGIDLGTSNCLAAKIEQDLFDERKLSLKCLHDEDGNESFPSVVAFKDREHYLVGESALEQLYSNPDGVVELTKVRLGKTNCIPVVISGETYNKTPQEISALMLRHFNHYRNNAIRKPVLTVPAFFDQSQKEATMQAGLLAELSIAQLIEEPTAAVMYQIYDDYQKHGINFFGDVSSKNVLVFDFGGGTLDLSLIRLTLEQGEVKPEVIAVGGDKELGGNLIDFIFTERIIRILTNSRPNDEFLIQVREAFNEYYENYHNNNSLLFPRGVTEEIKQFIFRLKRELERVKISLSAKEEDTIFIGRNIPPLPITRMQFENIVFSNSSIKEQIQYALQRIIEDAGNTAVNEILLVGGSSQIPYIQSTIIECFDDVHVPEEAIRTSSDYSHAVALGAAIQAALLAGIPVPPFQKNKCTSVVPRDIVLKSRKANTVLIKRGTPYPFTDEKKITFNIPHALSEAVPITIVEIEEGYNGQKEILISDYQYHLPLYYTGDQMIISMNIDSAGLYQVSAKHIPTKENVEFEVQKPFSIPDQKCSSISAQLASMTEES